jgi:hypothetical protein
VRVTASVRNLQHDIAAASPDGFFAL